jgi:hypothetical protein
MPPLDSTTRPRDGYPSSWGAARVSIFPVVGPTSYTQYTAPTTGGQDVSASKAGLKTFDLVIGGVSRDGLHRAEVVNYDPGTVGGITLSNAVCVLKWYVVATGAEAAAMANLSAAVVDLLAIGPK